MTKITHSFSSELDKLLESTEPDLTQLVSLPVKFNADDTAIRPVAEVLVSMAPGAICCRSQFLRNVNGVGGLLLHEETAALLVRGLSKLPARAAGERMQFSGQAAMAMSEIWRAFIEAWNRGAAPEYRMTDDGDGCAVEYYPSTIDFPQKSGVFPEVLCFTVRVGELTRPCALFLPFKVVQGSEIRSFAPTASFARVTHAETASLDLNAPPSTATAPRRAPSSAPAPIVFLDYSGLILPWLRKKVEDERLRYVLADGLAGSLRAGAGAPVAAVVAGTDLALLARLADFTVVEIRPRDELPLEVLAAHPGTDASSAPPLS